MNPTPPDPHSGLETSGLETSGLETSGPESSGLESSGVTGCDLAISRIVDRVDRLDDWSSLDQVAGANRGVWGDLVDALRHDAGVRAALQPAARTADRVSIAAGTSRVGGLPGSSRWRGLGGWLVAMVLGCAWLVTSWSGAEWSGGGRPDAGGSAVEVESVAAGAATAALPEIVRELAKVVVDARPSDDGRGLEVLYVRRQLERAVVRDLFQLNQDEHGAPVSIRINPASFAAATQH